jgi:tight adherence protein C
MLVIMFVVFTVVGAAAFSLYTIFFPEQTAADRLDRLTAAATVEDRTVDLTGERDATPLEQIAARIGQFAQSRSEESEEATKKLRDQLKHAGFKNRRAIDVFNGLRVALAMLAPVVVSPLAFVWKIQSTAFAMFIAGVAGYYFPVVRVQSMAQTRQQELLRAYPDALDLLVSCVDAGLSLDQAFRRVATEMHTVAPTLAREFALVNAEIGAGVDRMTALKHLEERTGLEEVRSLVNMLAQAERFGSSIADSLRMYSHVAREKRMSRAEEKAGQVGSKLTIVMILFFLPVLMLILMAPTGIRMME